MSKRVEKEGAEHTLEAVAVKPATARELAAAIRKSGLVGMWKDRTEISDSGKFARDLRKRASARKPK
ncbi:MAG: hypothetical protein AABO41_19975 [Acidobacteriota bacterium]